MGEAGINMSRNQSLTDNENIKYNKGDPIRCDCGKVIAFKKDGNIIIKCKHCKRQIAVFRAESLK